MDTQLKEGSSALCWLLGKSCTLCRERTDSRRGVLLVGLATTEADRATAFGAFFLMFFPALLGTRTVSITAAASFVIPCFQAESSTAKAKEERQD